MTKLKNTYHHSSLAKLIAGSFLGLLALILTGNAQNQDAVQQQLVETQENLQNVNMEIEKVRVEATQKESVQEALLGYNQVLTDTMKEIDPDRSQLIEKRKSLFEGLMENTDYSSMTTEEIEASRQMNQEFVQVREELQTVEAQANVQEPVSEALEAYNEVIVTEMAKLDPDIEAKLSKRSQLREQFMQLQQGIVQ